MDNNLTGRYRVFELQSYGKIPHDVVINFVGVGDPAKAALMGSSIYEATHFYDQIILNELNRNPSRKYIFLSSGAVYGDNFDVPVTIDSPSKINVNSLRSEDSYSVAKLYAEARHRSLEQFNIVDLRIFNYFSRALNLDARFFISDLLRSIRNGSVFETSGEDFARDFIHPLDFYKLICSVVEKASINVSLDCYSKSAVTKYEMLALFKEHFGLNYKVVKNFSNSIEATGFKRNYYSLNHHAEELGYRPDYTSAEVLVLEAQKIFEIAR
ncbi:NAD-dependent epimerase/dehydratase family protein [Pseudomonadales bacterium]|nr:NAD-dependent epimerase/dehydratase family protein [Pseudomonadales bacterium]